MTEDDVDDRENRPLVPEDVMRSGQLACAHCHESVDSVRGLEEGDRPRLEDRTLCWDCGEVSIYARTAFGYWSLRQPDEREAAELATEPHLREARAQFERARREGRSVRTVGHHALGRSDQDEDQEDAEQLVMVACEPADWPATAAKFDLTDEQLGALLAWTREHYGVPDQRQGLIRIDCRICELPTLVSPQAQQAVFTMKAQVVCVPCANAVAERFGG